MKTGISNSTESEFPYWILPDKPMSETKNVSHLKGSWTEWDQDATKKQLEQIRGYLGSATKGKWMETNGRFFFQLKEDFEMFQTMCLLGWA